MIDTHCHLDACEDPAGELVERARDAGVERMLAIGMNPTSCRHALVAADTHEEVYVAVGRHPHESRGFTDTHLQELAEMAKHPKVRAIGEAGLDFKRNYAPRKAQQLAFELQLELAVQLHLPLVIHTREASEDTFATLEREGPHGIPVIMHCFSLTDELDRCIENGYYCSFAGNVTYPNAKELQRAATQVPDHLLLVETDAPFLSPQEHRNERNEPAFVRSTAHFVAELRGQSYEQLEHLVDKNARWIFQW